MSCVGGGFICVCTTYRINEHDTFLKLHFTKSKWKIHARIRYLDFLEFFFPHFWYECLNEMLMWKFSFVSFIKECHYFDFFFFFFGYIGPKPITTSIFLYIFFFLFFFLLCFVLFCSSECIKLCVNPQHFYSSPTVVTLRDHLNIVSTFSPLADWR